LAVAVFERIGVADLHHGIRRGIDEAEITPPAGELREEGRVHLQMLAHDRQDLLDLGVALVAAICDRVEFDLGETFGQHGRVPDQPWVGSMFSRRGLTAYYWSRSLQPIRDRSDGTEGCIGS